MHYYGNIFLLSSLFSVKKIVPFQILIMITITDQWSSANRIFWRKFHRRYNRYLWIHCSIDFFFFQENKKISINIGIVKNSIYFSSKNIFLLLKFHYYYHDQNLQDIFFCCFNWWWIYNRKIIKLSLLLLLKSSIKCICIW